MTEGLQNSITHVEGNLAIPIKITNTFYALKLSGTVSYRYQDTYKITCTILFTAAWIVISEKWFNNHLVKCITVYPHNRVQCSCEKECECSIYADIERYLRYSKWKKRGMEQGILCVSYVTYEKERRKNINICFYFYKETLKKYIIKIVTGSKTRVDAARVEASFSLYTLKIQFWVLN